MEAYDLMRVRKLQWEIVPWISASPPSSHPKTGLDQAAGGAEAEVWTWDLQLLDRTRRARRSNKFQTQREYNCWSWHCCFFKYCVFFPFCVRIVACYVIVLLLFPVTHMWELICNFSFHCPWWKKCKIFKHYVLTHYLMGNSCPYLDIACKTSSWTIFFYKGLCCFFLLISWYFSSKLSSIIVQFFAY